MFQHIYFFTNKKISFNINFDSFLIIILAIISWKKLIPTNNFKEISSTISMKHLNGHSSPINSI